MDRGRWVGRLEEVIGNKDALMCDIKIEPTLTLTALPSPKALSHTWPGKSCWMSDMDLCCEPLALAL